MPRQIDTLSMARALENMLGMPIARVAASSGGRAIVTHVRTQANRENVNAATINITAPDHNAESDVEGPRGWPSILP